MMPHRLFAKQVAQATTTDNSLDLRRLGELVSSAYEEFERERRRTEHSIAVMIEEVDQLNRNLQALVAARTAELAEATTALNMTLDSVDQGIVMIDAEGRVSSYNLRFLEFTGLCRDDLRDKPRLGALVDRMVANGEFASAQGNPKNWAATADDQPESRLFEHTRPDGTVLRVQARQLPEGGEVRVLSDITDIVQRQHEVEQARRLLEETIENVTQGVMKISADRRIEYFNARVMELLGLPPDVLCNGMPFRALTDYQISAGEFAGQSEEFIQFVRSGGVLDRFQSYERERPNGKILDIRTIPLPDGSAVRTFTDVTEARLREKQLQRAESEFRSLFENSLVGIYRASLDGRNILSNPALVRLAGFHSEAEMLASGDFLTRNWYVDPNRRQQFEEQIARDGRISDFVSEVQKAHTGEKTWVSESAWIVRDENGAPLYYEGMVIDAADRKKAESKIQHLALHDVLTNLANRTLFLEKLTHAISTSRRGTELAILCLDLDRFKDVNDTMGHDAGDVLLRLAARRLSRVVPKGGTPARFGGDEFAVILPDLHERDTVVQLCKKIVHRLSMPYRVRGKRVFVGASVGVALAPTDGTDAHELLKKADIALYRAKRDGRGTYAFFDDGMTAAILARREVEQDLRRAIAHDEFVLFYQPIVDLEFGEPMAYEALIRWNHPQKGMLSPAYFIEIAEESGLILQIGEIALRQACETFAKLPANKSVSVNLSPVQFRNHQLAVSVINALAMAGLPPHRLILEITESVLLNDDSRTLDILRQLRLLGVQIALDDFGIGHSSLSYIQKFPFDKIKIDRSFVQDTDDGTMNMAIRRAILGLGHDLGVDVVVEGVETTQQRDMLIFEGARYAQGFLFGRPLPAETQFGPEFAIKSERKVA
jgi:diguanylate cyclase (GGDEF)-like protein/PAS domain S-box-containing protein